MEINIPYIQALSLERKKVLLRLDLNSPLDPEHMTIVNDNRIRQSIATIHYLLQQSAAVCIIAHQGDTFDYDHMVSLRGHAEYLGNLLDLPVGFIDDIAGPAAREAIARLPYGEVLMLENLRYLSEEVSTFEEEIVLSPAQMQQSYLVRHLAPLFEVYINDAFSAAHRNCPSMVAFQQLLPSAAGLLFMQEMEALHAVVHRKKSPSVFLLGGLKVDDAFAVIEQALQTEIADHILICGLTGVIMLIAMGYSIISGQLYHFLPRHSLDRFLSQAAGLLSRFSHRIQVPLDLAYEDRGQRKEVDREHFPKDQLFKDIGQKTIDQYAQIISGAGTIFTNGPAGIFEQPLFAKGTQALWQAVADSKGYTVVGGGDSVNAAAQFVDLSQIDYISTAGGAMTRYVAGRPLPLIRAMESCMQDFATDFLVPPPVEVSS